MAVLAEVVVPPREFVLADTLTELPGIRIEIQRVVGGTDYVTPYFWAAGGDLVAFDRELRSDDSTRDVVALQDSDDERLYRVEWEPSIPTLVDAVSDVRATILNAVNDEAGRWQTKLLFPDRGSLSEFHEYCLDRGFSLTLKRVYRPENPQAHAAYGVTEKQREALEAAYRAGYFDVPRDHTLSEVADELGISRNALSARLRRGHRNLLSRILVHDE